jgi:predicted MFS family arabinose efflux permease
MAVSDQPTSGTPTGTERNLRRELALFLAVAAALGMSGGIFETTFNNFLNDTFAIGAGARGKLEFPRELPGFLVTAMGGLLFFLSETRLGVLSALGIALGTAGLAFLGTDYAVMIAFMVIWSAGNHLMMPVSGTIALSLAPLEKRAARMGQINAVQTGAMILGAVVVWGGLQYLDIGYRGTFLVAAFGALVAALFVSFIRPLPKRAGRRPKLVVKRRYSLYYLLNVFSGARKQVFITFGVFVLVKVYGEPAPTIAKLWIVASLIGVFVQPQLGKLIDRFGERKILMAGALVLIGVCLGYGFAAQLPLARPVRLIYACYVLDNVLFAVHIARSTYLDKIAESEADIHASLSVGVTIDHAVSMTIPILGGIVWEVYGYPYVFLGAAGIAVLNLIAASFVRVPARPTPAPTSLPLDELDIAS